MIALKTDDAYPSLPRPIIVPFDIDAPGEVDDGELPTIKVVAMSQSASAAHPFFVRHRYWEGRIRPTNRASAMRRLSAIIGCTNARRFGRWKPGSILFTGPVSLDGGPWLLRYAEVTRSHFVSHHSSRVDRLLRKSHAKLIKNT